MVILPESTVDHEDARAASRVRWMVRPEDMGIVSDTDTQRLDEYMRCERGGCIPMTDGTATGHEHRVVNLVGH